MKQTNIFNPFVLSISMNREKIELLSFYEKKRYIAFIKMNSDNECPICFEEYGKRLDGTILIKDGKTNSDMAEECEHFCCVNCLQTIYDNIECFNCVNIRCPICREDWTAWLVTHYDPKCWEDDDKTDEE